jgi:hypothetical protein
LLPDGEADHLSTFCGAAMLESILGDWITQMAKFVRLDSNRPHPQGAYRCSCLSEDENSDRAGEGGQHRDELGEISDLDRTRPSRVVGGSAYS